MCLTPFPHTARFFCVFFSFFFLFFFSSLVIAWKEGLAERELEHKSFYQMYEDTWKELRRQPGIMALLAPELDVLDYPVCGPERTSIYLYAVPAAADYKTPNTRHLKKNAQAYHEYLLRFIAAILKSRLRFDSFGHDGKAFLMDCEENLFFFPTINMPITREASLAYKTVAKSFERFRELNSSYSFLFQEICTRFVWHNDFSANNAEAHVKSLLNAAGFDCTRPDPLPRPRVNLAGFGRTDEILQELEDDPREGLQVIHHENGDVEYSCDADNLQASEVIRLVHERVQEDMMADEFRRESDADLLGLYPNFFEAVEENPGYNICLSDEDKNATKKRFRNNEEEELFNLMDLGQIQRVEEPPTPIFPEQVHEIDDLLVPLSEVEQRSEAGKRLRDDSLVPLSEAEQEVTKLIYDPYTGATEIRVYRMVKRGKYTLAAETECESRLVTKITMETEYETRVVTKATMETFWGTRTIVSYL